MHQADATHRDYYHCAEAMIGRVMDGGTTDAFVVKYRN